MRHGDDREAGRLGRARQHDARRARSPATSTRLTGHKWFCSAPMCDVFLVLAQTDEGVTCFAVPRILPDGTRNAFRLQRLKDKLGNRSNALERGRVRRHVGPARRRARPRRPDDHRDGRPHAPGLRDRQRRRRCAAAVANATWHAAHRSAFGKLLADQPLMQNVLADLAIESEAATALAMRLARAYDEERHRRSSAWPPRSASTGSASACPAHRRRGDGVPRRQRLRRGVRACRACTARRR